jgi:Tol biopolymer transport system component
MAGIRGIGPAGGRALRAGLVLATLVACASPGAARAVTFTQFTSSNLGGDDAPCWSMDGGAVFYSSRVTGFPYIYRKNLGDPVGSSGTRLTSGTTDEYQVTVSADGAYAIMCEGDSLSSRHLWRCPATGGAPLTKVTYGPFFYVDPDWFGSGTGLVAFSTNRGGAGFQIWTLVPNGTLPALTYTPVTGPGFNDMHPSFSPTGQQIVFASNRSGGSQLFVTTWSGSSWGAPAQLTSGGGTKANPCWSPNGLHIAYEVTSGGNAELWVVESNGTNARIVTTAGSYDARPCWSPDGNQLAFVSDRSGAKYIWIAGEMSTPAANQTWGRLKDMYRR